MQLEPVSAFESFLWSALYYLGVGLFIVIPILTAYWALIAFRKSRKIGFVFLGLFSLTPYVTFALNQISHEIHREEIERMNAAREDGVIVVERDVSLPIYQLIFAAGVFYLYRAETQKANQPPQTRATSGPV